MQCHDAWHMYIRTLPLLYVKIFCVYETILQKIQSSKTLLLQKMIL